MGERRKPKMEAGKILTYRPAKEIDTRLRQVAQRAGLTFNQIIDACLAEKLKLENPDWAFQLNSTHDAIRQLGFAQKKIAVPDSEIPPERKE